MDDTFLVTLEELEPRLDWTMDEAERGIARGALYDASNLVLAHGDAAWTAETAPSIAKSIVATAATRYLRNPDGYTSSRAGDETVQWSDLGHDSGGVYLTKSEIALLTRLANPYVNTVVEVPTYGWNSKQDVPRPEFIGMVPAAGGGFFPYYSSDDSPWP